MPTTLHVLAHLTQKRRPASDQNNHSSSACFYLSQGQHDRVHAGKLNIPHGDGECLIHTYTTLLYEVIYTCSILYIYFGYLGVVISQLPPRRVHTGKCTTAILAELIRMIGCYPFEVPNDDDNSQGRSVRMPKRRKAAPHFCGGKALVNMSAA